MAESVVADKEEMEGEDDEQRTEETIIVSKRRAGSKSEESVLAIDCKFEIDLPDSRDALSEKKLLHRHLQGSVGWLNEQIRLLDPESAGWRIVVHDPGSDQAENDNNDEDALAQEEDRP